MARRMAAALAGLTLPSLALFFAAPTRAEVVSFHATLGGHQTPTDTGSNATGEAAIAVDTTARTVDVDLTVHGLTIDQLWGPLKKAAMGPIHLHRYSSHDHSDPNSSALAFPLPMGPSYTATADGFRVVVKGAAYAQAAALVKSDVSFDDFLMSMKMGAVVLNIHTEADHDGEISGEVTPVANAST